jgi:hypothetical protein
MKIDLLSVLLLLGIESGLELLVYGGSFSICLVQPNTKLLFGPAALSQYILDLYLVHSLLLAKLKQDCSCICHRFNLITIIFFRLPSTEQSGLCS